MMTLIRHSFSLGLAGAALLLAGCQSPAVAPSPDAPLPMRPLTGAERNTLASANDFAFRAFAALRGSAAPADNLCISPLSISAALTMAYNGADGATKVAMKQTLGFAPQTDTEINESFQSLFALFGGLDPQVTFTVGNSIWHGQQYQLQAPFVQLNQTYFGATVQGVNFALPTTKDVINGWVNTQTRGKIPTIIDQTSSDDVLYLINALYFKGTWTYRFNPQLTAPGPFYPEAGPAVNKDFMRLTAGRYRRYADAQQQVIDLPYGNRRFSMTLVLPQGNTSLATVAGRLSPAQLSTWLAAADSTRLELRLPKFRLEYEKELTEALTQLGMGVAFSGQADFGRMLAGPKLPLAITKVQHKTFLEVNEEGTEAAAVTAVGIGITSLPPVVQVNRPFVFLIREQSSGAILFIGRVMNP